MLQMTLIAVGTFIPMLLLLVVIHELGHYLTAKWLGVKVLEFGVGYPPRAFGFYVGNTTVLIDNKTQCSNFSDVQHLVLGTLIRVYSHEDAKGNLIAQIILASDSKGKFPALADGTVRSGNLLQHQGKLRSADATQIQIADMLYSVNWTPLGGFVRLAGENDPSIPKSLATKPPWARAVILVAGSAMNAIFPIVVFAIMFMIPHDVVTGNIMITDVLEGSPASLAGLKQGDIIVQTNDSQITTTTDLIRSITLDAGTQMRWVIARGAVTETILVTPRVNPPPNEGATGIKIELVNPTTETRFQPPWTALISGVTSSFDMLVLMKEEISRWIGGETQPEFSGPIGIAQITGEITMQSGLRGWLMLSILISINLAILNILPIPMLDGGRLLFVIIEWVRRGKRIPAEKEGLVHIVGFIVLIGLIIVVSANDINRLLQGGSLLGG